MFIATFLTLLFIPLVFYFLVKVLLTFIRKEVNTEGCNRVCDTLIKVAKAIMKFFYFLILFVFLLTTCSTILNSV